MSEIRPKDVYKGKRRYGWLVTTIFMVVALLILTGVVLFYYMQRYIVISGDEIKLEIPFLMDDDRATSKPAPTSKIDVPDEIVIETPDFSQLDTIAGENIPELEALFFSAGEISDSAAPVMLARLEREGANAAVLELKPSSGALSYASGTEIPKNYGINGTVDLESLVASLKDKDVYLVAQISCFADTLFASRNSPLSLKKEGGQIYADEDGQMWLDPYSHEVRSYIFSLMDEAADMGFDEILLTNVSHPDAQGLQYSESSITLLDIPSTIAGFSVRAGERMASRAPVVVGEDLLDKDIYDDGGAKDAPETDVPETDTPETDTPETEAPETELPEGSEDDAPAPNPGRVLVSAILSTDTLRNGANPSTGEDPFIYFRFFDRVYVRTDSDNLSSNIKLAEEYITTGTVDERFVPIVTASLSNGSFLIK